MSKFFYLTCFIIAINNFKTLSRYKLEIIYKNSPEGIFIQRQHFQSLNTQDEWLSDSVRIKFLFSNEKLILLNYLDYLWLLKSIEIAFNNYIKL